MALDEELAAIIRDENRPQADREAAAAIRQRHHGGEFDASLEESDEWAASPDGRAAFDQLKEGK